MTATIDTTTPRTPGKRGRLPQLQGEKRLAIRWAHQYRAIPEPAYPIDVSRGITDWGMLGNDQYGNCGPCGVAHERMIAGYAPTAAEVVKMYLAYTDGQDVGVVIADFLLWCYQQGLIEGFAPVELGSIDGVMAEFNRGVILGVNLTDDAEQLFSANQPWTTAAGEKPDDNEGHVVLKIKSVDARSDGTCVTWGADEAMTGPWQAECVEEAWVIVTKEDVDEADYKMLVADLDALPKATGPTPAPPEPTPQPAPVPPTPAPAPAPAPSPDDIHQFLRQVHQILVETRQKLIDVASSAMDEVELLASQVVSRVEGDEPA